MLHINTIFWRNNRARVTLTILLFDTNNLGYRLFSNLLTKGNREDLEVLKNRLDIRTVISLIIDLLLKNQNFT